MAVVLCTTSTAQAHWYRTPWYIKHKIHTSQGKISAYKKNIAHARGVVTYFSQTKQFQSSTLVQSHRYIIKRSTRAIAKLQYVGLPVHYRGWLCITNGAYPGAAHEGNGYNGPYSGPLGMTTPWMGHYPPGSDWVHSNPITVYAIAEHEAAKYKFSYDFMKGQWPNTYPPCADRF